ncbi:NADH ubiquinone oxidoreductase 20 kDa subunit [Candidatus Caldarchaeum subterraneum]|mgnify:CR=1 FL=1|uniref:NADH ubiquinone oxidoreductase 20 kDa subunit n=1 Tax=Caldiarchaeum subterraneum TaxID=311458 RepID=E6N715_CALS0|nr:NADH ubiquinone oxidoreductase 20 kDa subunit [Candidatus Caldarchaeum subterraneum]BAJ48091.1 NADH ubiquinone oxidoreductase 20 kDa subunit [Candidatus Caldarchaeum subterraneum]BAJ50874.1 NADH ubiquinone oxidoreductase 20 kDa subunit [Candidatus Caldarchaeum subterraneum]
MKRKPKIAVYKFASCDGCQLSVLDLEDELLAIGEKFEIAYFLEASRAVVKGPYDIALVEGSITTPHDAALIKEVRKNSRILITIGACATAGGIQALRNWRGSAEFMKYVYARPEYIETLDKSTPVADHVPVDFELRGCPINKYQLLEVMSAFLAGRAPNIPSHSVCVECKLRGTVCVMVAQGIPCLGPVTQAGCGAICPSYNRGCYGCFGPKETPNTKQLVEKFVELGKSREEAVMLLRLFNAWAPGFREVET